jgi:hypothetical protein
MLRLVDRMLLALGRYGTWARSWMVYRALALLATPEPPSPRR